MNSFFINPYSVIFLPEIDEENNFNTIVYNYKIREVLKINSFGYDILYIINQHPGIDFENLIDLVCRKCNLVYWENKTKILNFLNKMIDCNVVIQQ